MSVNLKKGEKISLTKPGLGLKKVRVGLGWDEAPVRRGLFFSTKAPSIDCDASVLLCGEDGRLIGGDINNYCVYFGNLAHSSGAIIHAGDNLTGSGEGDDEQITVDLSKIPMGVSKLVFVVNIYDASKKNQHFGMIRNAYIRLVDLSNNAEICRFNLTEDYTGMTGMIVGELYRRNGEWKFNAIGAGVREASRLSQLFAMYQ